MSKQRPIIEGLERSFARVPIEEAKRLARQVQRVLEKEWKPLRAGSDKLPAVLAKLQALRTAELHNITVAMQRQAYLDSLFSADSDDTADNSNGYDEWLDCKYYRLVCDYLAREGRIAEARALAAKLNIDAYVDIDIVEQWHRVVQALHDGSTSEALQWCSENRNHLKKLGSLLEWRLRRQDFVELVRASDKAAAVVYAKRHFPAIVGGTWGGPTVPHHEVALTLALLVAIRPQFWPPRYSQLLDRKLAWQDLRVSFTAVFFALYGLPARSPLPALLQCGCAAFKSPACSASNRDSHGGAPENADCPSCQAELAPLTKTLPYAHHEFSRLICRLSGAVMSEDNAPMALPNGQIYSFQMQRQRGGWVECPVTKEVFRFDQLKKCFIL